MIDYVSLREKIKSRISKRRYVHTLSVEDVAVRLGSLICPTSLDTVRLAALLHDIAKEIAPEEQAICIERMGLLATEEDLEIPESLHAITAVGLIMQDFLEYAKPPVLSAVLNHCVGDRDMSLIDKIIYVADYIEPGRNFETAASIRSFLLDGIESLSLNDRLKRLDQATLMCAKATVHHLTSCGHKVHSKTLEMIKYLESIER